MKLTQTSTHLANRRQQEKEGHVRVSTPASLPSHAEPQRFRRFVFFVFFTFKTWKRLLLADGPRAVLNGITLYAYGAYSRSACESPQQERPTHFTPPGQSKGWTSDLGAYFNGGFAVYSIVITVRFSICLNNSVLLKSSFDRCCSP